MRAHSRFSMLLTSFLVSTACAAAQTIDNEEIPRQCPSDYRPPALPEIPEGCDPAIYEEKRLAGCFTETYMIDVLTDPAPSMATQEQWSRYVISFYRNGKDPETGRYKLAPFRDVVNATSRDYIASLPPPSDDELAALRARTNENLIEVEGGTFQMGDFGSLLGKAPLTGAQDDGPLHEVRLSDYAISKYRVSYGEYDLYSRATGAEPIGFSGIGSSVRFQNFYAGNMTWRQASSYCQWLGKQIGRPMDLPTEAQWEYAARARGNPNLLATTLSLEDLNGGRVLENYAECRAARTYATPVKTYPPNAIGLYGMVGRGGEWVRDWYAADYYQTLAGKVTINPTGPASGEERVVRDATGTRWDLTFSRDSRAPADRETSLGFRCVTLAD